MASREFDWLVREGSNLTTAYDYQWIAVDGEQIPNNEDKPELVIVASGDSLGEVIALARLKELDPFKLFYVFIRPHLENYSSRV